ncbi:MAG: molybdopterin-dependent oxidoreductase [Gammaproteobacteria bacterium]
MAARPSAETGARKKVPTYCYQCVNGPDLLTVEVIDGVATKVEPNFAAGEHHPAEGKVCVKPYGLVQKVYNPHRILNPKRRTNPNKGRKEDPRWVDISWDEALDTIAEKMKASRDKGLLDENGDPRFAFTTGGAATPFFYAGTLGAFLGAWGPYDNSLGAGGTVKCYHSEHIYGELWHRAFTVMPDTPRAEYVISFGNNIDASGGVTAVYRQANARARGWKRIQFEPHLSVTGAKASEWVPIKTKTDSAVLFAMLHVLLHEHDVEKLDYSFLKDMTSCPYLIAPNGYYLRDADSEKPLVWDQTTGRAVPYDTPNIDPALEGKHHIANAIEIGADNERWLHENVVAPTAFAKLKAHVDSNTPEWAAEISDVPAETIRRIANEYLAAACIGQTYQVEGRELPFRPVTVVLGKSVNNGWGAYECVWARTMMQVLVGALEVPGGMLGSATHLTGPDWDRMANVVHGEDGFMHYPFNPTDKEHWLREHETRHAARQITPMVGDSMFAGLFGSTSLAWLRLQGRAAESWVKPNPPDVWFVYKCNPNMSFSETSRLGETIADFPFMVGFAYTDDETNHFADILLPEAIDLESTQLIRVGGQHYFEQQWEAEGWVLRQKVVEPQGEAKDFSWICNELATRIGILEEYNQMINMGACGVPLKTDNWDYSLATDRSHDPEDIWDAVCKAASADLTAGEEVHGLDWFKEKGFQVRPFSSINWYLYPKMVDLGLRFELPYQERIFRMGQQLANRLHETGVDWWDKQLEEYEAMPSWKDLNKFWDDIIEKNWDVKASDFPFWLLGARSMQYAWGGNTSLQMIHEVAQNVAGHDGILINASKAAELGVNEGDWIEVKSPVGTAHGQARLRQGIRKDVIVMVGQFGHWKMPYAKDIKAPGLNDLVPMHPDFLDGHGSSIDATKVSVRKVGVLS